MLTTDPYMVDLLNGACSNSGETEYGSYRVETHCVAYTYTAKVAARDGDGLPTAWFITSVEKEDC